jgi:hypothetical protein
VEPETQRGDVQDPLSGGPKVMTELNRITSPIIPSYDLHHSLPEQGSVVTPIFGQQLENSISRSIFADRTGFSRSQIFMGFLERDEKGENVAPTGDNMKEG